jgi:uncharacterized protein YndB with AHSA1/START domain
MRIPTDFPHAVDAARTTVEIAAPPEAVFRALADPRELAAWLGGDTADGGEPLPRSGTPAQVVAGQRWRTPALAPDGTPGSVLGEYLLVDPPRRLETTWRASWDELAADVVHFELTPVDVGGTLGTRLVVTHTRATARFHVTAQSAALGGGEWAVRLARLAAYVVAPPAFTPFGEPAGALVPSWPRRGRRAPFAIHHGD